MTVPDLFKDLADSVRALKTAEDRYKKFMERKCDWDDPSDVQSRRRELRGKKRERVIARFAPDRKCPQCRETVLNRRSWVVNRRQTRILCRSCWMRLFQMKKLEREGKMAHIRLKQAIARAKGDNVRFVFNGVSLETAIQLAGMTKAHFSRRAGWSAPYTQKLVMQKVKSVNADTAKVILMVLAEGDVEYEMERTTWEEIFGVRPPEGESE